MVNITTATFECSAPDLDSCPEESLPEFAFIGRSNVGKSSLLNLLSGRQDLARVSRTPGFTRHINIFTINERWRLVDLPGYGYARVARKDSARFNRSVSRYLARRPNLCCVFALIESALPPQAIDVEFVEWLARNEVPFVLVFTKTDKASAQTVRANMQAFTHRIASWFVKLPCMFTCSAETGHGRRRLLEVIDETLSAAAQPPAQADGGEKAAGTTRRSGGTQPPRKRRPDLSRPW
jgi:GTP-binding protein